MNKQTAVGAFVLGGLVLTVTAIVLFGKFHFLHPPGHDSIVFENSVSGLNVGSPVTFRGVRIGAVDSIGILFDQKTNRTYIPVTVEIETNLVKFSGVNGAAPVHIPNAVSIGLRASLKTQSFVTGQTEIDLDFFPGSPAVLHSGVTNLTEIPTRETGIQQLTEELSELPLRDVIESSKDTLGSLRALSEKLDSSLPPLVASLKVTADKSSLAVDSAATAITDLQHRLDVTLANIDRFAINGEDQLTARGAELHSLLVTSNDAAARARDLLTDLNSLTSDRAAARVNIESSLRDLAAATASLRGFASDVEQNPQLLLTGRRR